MFIEMIKLVVHMIASISEASRSGIEKKVAQKGTLISRFSAVAFL